MPRRKRPNPQSEENIRRIDTKRRAKKQTHGFQVHFLRGDRVVTRCLAIVCMEERKPQDAPPESLSRRPCAACREENSWALDRCVRVGAHLPPVCFPALQKSRRKIFRPRCDPTVDDCRRKKGASLDFIWVRLKTVGNLSAIEPDELLVGPR